LRGLDEDDLGAVFGQNHSCNRAGLAGADLQDP
jgi:hypothetical protein